MISIAQTSAALAILLSLIVVIGYANWRGRHERMRRAALPRDELAQLEAEDAAFQQHYGF